jgi:hypothetical protein
LWVGGAILVSLLVRHCMLYFARQLKLRKELVEAEALSSFRKEVSAMTAAGFRKIAMSFPEAVEGSHFGNADFRVGGKIFATLSLQSEGYGVLLLTPEQQAGMVEDAPVIFSRVPGGWGKKGSTRVLLAKVPPDILEAVLRTAWLRKAPKRLLPPTSRH